MALGTKTIKIKAFGETREVEAFISEGQPGRYWVDGQFAARFRTGKKLHMVTVHLWDSSKKDADGTFIVGCQQVTTLNRHAYVCGWWTERCEPYRSQHVGSR